MQAVARRLALAVAIGIISTPDSGNAALYVASNNNAVGLYDATTGGAIISNFLTGLPFVNAIAVETSPIPEPGTVLSGVACLGVAVWRRRRK
jgi:hypothetical protein